MRFHGGHDISGRPLTGKNGNSYLLEKTWNYARISILYQICNIAVDHFWYHYEFVKVPELRTDNKIGPDNCAVRKMCHGD